MIVLEGFLIMVEGFMMVLEEFMIIAEVWPFGNLGETKYIWVHLITPLIHQKPIFRFVFHLFAVTATSDD